MKVLRMIMMTVLLLVFANAEAQQDMFVNAKPVKGIKVTVKVLNETQVVIVPDGEPNQRYVANDLPAELKKDGLHLTINGEKGEIPANVRMIGTPFRMTSIKVSGADQKKYKLSKRKYCLKKK